MLFGYPIAATNENWLHDCLCEIVIGVHDCIAIDEPLPAWPEIVPFAFRAQLKGRTGLRDRVEAYANAARPLSLEELASIADAMTGQNRVADLLAGACDCLAVGDLPEAVRQPVLEMFGFGFTLLGSFFIRDRQYKIIYDQLKCRVCPFCGCEDFESPKGRREALDHYLAESQYPFAASNLRNLAPMGHKCNSQYKLSKNILRREDGSRRRAFDPYQTESLQVSLGGSQVNQGVDGSLISEWLVEFSINGEETETWDQVFSIRERYKRDYLEGRSFLEYLTEFQNWSVSATVNITSDDDLLEAMGKYEKFLTSFGYKDRNFLRAAVFKMLLGKCKKGCDRVLGVMRDLVNLPQPASA